MKTNSVAVEAMETAATLAVIPKRGVGTANLAIDMRLLFIEHVSWKVV